jgi:hypothetical protein
MISFPDILTISKDKTRVLICTSNPSITNLILEILNFYGKEFDFFLENESIQNEGNDFVILETSDLEKATQFKANIFFISDDIKSNEIDSAIKNITPGGILIYPTNLEKTVEEGQHFFRKLPFSPSLFLKKDHQFILDTEMGSIPLFSTDENLIKNLEGIKFLCQQFGVMEEEFYEPVMSFE